MTALGIFLIVMGVDYAWARYSVAAAHGQAHRAAAWSIATYLLSAVNVLAYTHNHWLLIPAVIGAYAGTFIAVRRHGR
jgi:hypothetical protein